jgi:hypothetical protein
VGVVLSSAVALAYGLVRGVQIGNATMFPIGSEEVAVLVCAAVLLGLVGAMFAVAGRSLILRKWVMPGWALAAVAGIFIVAASVGVGFAADIAPTIKHRFQAIEHSRNIAVQPIKQMHLLGNNVQYRIVTDSKPSVEIRTLGTVDTKAVKVAEKDGVLTIDSRQIHGGDCTMICPYDRSNVEVVVHAPRGGGLPFDATGGAKVIVSSGNW